MRFSRTAATIALLITCYPTAAKPYNHKNPGELCIQYHDELSDGDNSSRHETYYNAEIWCKQAAEIADSANGYLILGTVYLARPSQGYSGLDGAYGQNLDPDYENARISLLKSAELNDPTAQLLLATLYHTGRGVPIDRARAAFWYRKAADFAKTDIQELQATMLGIKITALRNLGLLYIGDTGALKDIEHGARLLEEASELGGPMATYILSALHLHEKLENSSDERFFQLATQSANAGFGPAQYFVGAIHLNDQAYVDSYIWCKLSEESIGSPSKNQEPEVRILSEEIAPLVEECLEDSRKGLLPEDIPVIDGMLRDLRIQIAENETVLSKKLGGIYWR